MAAACAVCNAKRSHSIHLRALGREGWHEYADASKPGLKPMSEGRRTYLESEEHREAYAKAEVDAVCLGHLAGAPGTCLGPLTKHHIAGRSAGLEAAEREFPVVMLCQWLNGAIESDPRVRRWAERATFVRDGKEYPFRLSARMARQLVTTDKDSHLGERDDD